MKRNWPLAAQILISTLILNTEVYNTSHVVAELSVMPLWNVTVHNTNTESCDLAIDNNLQDLVTFAGDTVKTCGVQLTSSNGTAALIRIPRGTLVYAERKENILKCQMKYVSLVADAPCFFAFSHPKLQLFLQGDGVNGSNINISQMPVNVSTPICSDGTGSKGQHTSKVGQTNHCQAHEFNNLISCYHSPDYSCSFKFSDKCQATLGNRVVEFQCPDDNVHSSHKALIVYPPGIITLDLASQNIVELKVNPFMTLKSLKRLLLAHNDLVVLPLSFLSGLANLEYLTLHGNRLSSLDGDIFIETKKLTKLSLWNNNIKQLPNYLFHGLKNLNELDLAKNYLIILSKGLFTGLTNLKYLDLRENQIKSLDEALFNDTNKLTKLYLHYNDLRFLPKGLFMGLANLEYLDLTGNQIKSLDDPLFNETKKLTWLYLYKNNLTVLPKGLFMGLTNLEYLFLSENQIKSLDEALFNETDKLTTLNLAYNKLTVLPIGLFVGIKSVEVLSLSSNRINSLDGKLFNKNKRLTELYLNENNLKLLPKMLFTGLTNLELLYLSKNQISSLHEELFIETSKLTELHLYENNLTVLPKSLFVGLKNLQLLSVSRNRINLLDETLFNETNNLIGMTFDDNNLTLLPNRLLTGFTNLVQLNLERNHIASLHENLFKETRKLIFLGLNHNNLVQLPNNVFKGLSNLQTLGLGDNNIVDLNKEMFRDLSNLRFLYLQGNRFNALNFDLFQYTRKLKLLNLSGNRLLNIPDLTNLRQLFFLNIKDNKMTDITKETFSYLPDQTELIASQPEICECYVSDDITCTAVEDRSQFLTCDRLLSDKALVVVMWIIGLNAVGGNIFVLCRRHKTTNKNQIQTFLLRNLAMSDLLMGVYMLLIASADIHYGEYFPMRAKTWRSGITCRVAGTLSIISSEASVFFVTLISVDRFVSIKYHNSPHKLGRKSSAVVAIILWMMALVLGIVPSSLAGKNDLFYDNSHVCIGLPLSKLQLYDTEVSAEEWVCADDDFTCYYKQRVQSQYVEVNGMIFASVMFLGVNFICYLAILACYEEIIRTFYKSSKRAGRNPEMKEQLRLTSRVAAIVLTDFACWFPIIIIGVLVQVGVLTLPPDVFAWCVTFVLPINSAINPYLYTIASVISERRKQIRANDLRHGSHQCNRRGKAPDLELGAITK